jgi:hypothetical protein
MRLIVAATVLLAATVTAAASQARVLDRVIEQDIRVHLPLLPCTVPGVAIRIAESLPVPLGLELVPEPCGEPGKQAPERENEVVLTGMSVSRAFDGSSSWTNDTFGARPMASSSFAPA